MPEIITNTPRVDKDAWQALTKALATIPLERCTEKKCLITGEIGWHAPEGHLFKLTGEFILRSQDSGFTMGMGIEPTKSIDLLIAKYPEIYKSSLKVFDDEPDIYEGYRDGIEVFLENLGNSYSYYGDPYRRVECLFGKSLQATPDYSMIIIYSDFDFEYSDATYYAKNISVDSKEKQTCIVQYPSSRFDWDQDYAMVKPTDRFLVEIIEEDLSRKSELLLPPQKDRREVKAPIYSGEEVDDVDLSIIMFGHTVDQRLKR